MQTTRADPVIAEVRAVRDGYAARFGYDVSAIFRDLRERQETSGRVYVRYPPRDVDAGSGLDDSAARSE